jgi:uncharacterized protein with HEPN domain
MSSPKKNKLRLLHIRDACEEITAFLADGVRDRKTFNAVSFNLSVIGEAARHISEEMKEKHSEIPWPKMIAMRNIVVHEYFGRDEDTIWETASRDIPVLAKAVRDLLTVIEKEGG